MVQSGSGEFSELSKMSLFLYTSLFQSLSTTLYEYMSLGSVTTKIHFDRSSYFFSKEILSLFSV